MPMRFHTGPHSLVATVVSAAALALAVPAFAQTTGADASAGNTGSLPAGQSSQPMQSAAPTAQNDSGSSNADPSNDSTPPPQQLPEPKSSDYGASNYNAPDDTELAEFAATHHPPAENNADNGGHGMNADNGNGDSMNTANNAATSASDNASTPAGGAISNSSAAPAAASGDSVSGSSNP